MDAMLWELLADGSPNDDVEVLIKLSELVHVPADTVEVVAQIGNIISCRIRRGDIENVRSLKGVLSMKASRPLTIDLPFSEEEIENIEYEEIIKTKRRPSLSLTGKGVAIGITDWGIDFTHPNFVNADKTTRFLALWDQGADYDGVNVYGYGTIHYQNALNDALNNATPFNTLGYQPGKTDIFHQGMHGTHVLDIGAGNGTVGEMGIAPNADLIAVHLATDRFKDLMGLGDSVRVFDGIHFLDTVAGEQPLVINMSVGSHGDAHAGLTLIEQAIDNLVTSKANRAVVQSCGNYYKGHTHTKGILTANKPVVLEWLISKRDKTPNEIEIWYEPNDRVQVDIQSPLGDFVLTKQSLGHSTIRNDKDEEIGRYYHRENEPNTLLHQIFIILTEKAVAGKWQVVLTGTHIENGRYQAWIERDIKGGVHQSRFPLYQADAHTTTGSICNGFHTICVGAYDAEDPQKRIGLFSSVGPTWDGRLKPDCAAQGVNIRAAKSASPFQNRSEGELTIKTGTSMAAPYVSGAIALLYEAAKGPLSINAVKQALFAACEQPPTTLSLQERSRYGQGIFDIKRMFSAYLDTKTVVEDSFEETVFDIEPFIENDYEPIIQPKKENKMAERYYDRESAPMSSLMEACQEEFPELNTQDLIDYFRNMPSDRTAWDGGLDVRRGDILVRRQFGHHEPAWYGVVEWVEGNRARVHTARGSKQVRLTKDGQRLDWELKKVRPQYKVAPKTADAPTLDDLEDENISNYEEKVAFRGSLSRNLKLEWLATRAAKGRVYYVTSGGNGAWNSPILFNIKMTNTNDVINIDTTKFAVALRFKGAGQPNQLFPLSGQGQSDYLVINFRKEIEDETSKFYEIPISFQDINKAYKLINTSDPHLQLDVQLFWVEEGVIDATNNYYYSQLYCDFYLINPIEYIDTKTVLFDSHVLDAKGNVTHVNIRKDGKTMQIKYPPYLNDIKTTLASYQNTAVTFEISTTEAVTNTVQNQVTVSLMTSESKSDSSTVSAKNTTTSSFSIGDDFMKAGLESSTEIGTEFQKTTTTTSELTKSYLNSQTVEKAFSIEKKHTFSVSKSKDITRLMMKPLFKPVAVKVVRFKKIDKNGIAQERVEDADPIIIWVNETYHFYEEYQTV